MSGGRAGGKTALVEGLLRQHIQEHGTKRVLLCGVAPATIEMRRRLGLPEPPPHQELKSIFEMALRDGYHSWLQELWER